MCRGGKRVGSGQHAGPRSEPRPKLDPFSKLVNIYESAPVVGRVRLIRLDLQEEWVKTVEPNLTRIIHFYFFSWVMTHIENMLATLITDFF